MSVGEEPEAINSSSVNESQQIAETVETNTPENQPDNIETRKEIENTEEESDKESDNIGKMIQEAAEKFIESNEEELKSDENKIHITEKNAGPELLQSDGNNDTNIDSPPIQSQDIPTAENPEKSGPDNQSETPKDVVIDKLGELMSTDTEKEKKEVNQNPMEDPTLMTAVKDLMIPPEISHDEDNMGTGENRETGENDFEEEENNVENQETGENDFEEDKNNEEKQEDNKDAEEKPNEENNDENNTEDEEESKETDEEFQDEEKKEEETIFGMKVVDNFSSPEDLIPNVAKTIDLNELPLLETPADIENQCKKQISYFQQKKSLPQNTDVLCLLKYLQRQKVNSIQQSKYMDAHNYEELIRNITEYNASQKKTELFGQMTGQLEDRIHELENELKKSEKERENEIKKATIDHEKHLQKLHETQNRELSKFEEKWNDTSFLRQFEKPSPKLLQMTTVERSLVVSGDYERADYVHSQVEQMQVEESEEAQKRAVSVMNSEQKKLLLKHKREEETIVEQFNVIIDKIKKTSDLEQQIIGDRLNRVKKEYEDLKNPKSSKLPPLKATTQKEHVVTPRTQSRMVICKQTVKNPRITVKPLGAIVKDRKTRHGSGFNTSKL